MELLLTCLLAFGLLSASFVGAKEFDVVVVVVVVDDVDAVVENEEDVVSRSDFRLRVNFQAFFNTTSESGSRPSGTKECDHCDGEEKVLTVNNEYFKHSRKALVVVRALWAKIEKTQ